MTAEQVELLKRGGAARWPYVFAGGGAIHMEGEDQWRAKVPTLLPGFVPELRAAVDAELERQARVEAFADDEDARAARRAALEPHPELIEIERAEAAAAVARHEAERPRRLEEKLDRLLALLEKAVK